MQVQDHFQQLNGSDHMPDGEAYFQYLQDMAMDPVNLNTANLDRLMDIPGMKQRLAQAIIQYRKQVKPFETIRELTSVKGIGAATLRKMLPFVTIGHGKALHQRLYTDPHYWSYGGHLVYLGRFHTIMQQPEGYRRPDSLSHYAGNRYQYYQRISYESPHWGCNITQQKDPGETMDGRLGFDYTSFNLELRHNGKLKELVLGDYSLSFGQGLLLGSAFGFGKGSNVTDGPTAFGNGLRGYRSSGENHFMRGIAATFGRKLQTTLFVSRRRYSASVIQGDTVRNPSMTGLYRTATERARRYDIGSWLYGGHLMFHTAYLRLGLTVYDNHFDHFIERGSTFYQQYDFQGSRLSGVSANAHWVFRNGSVFGEIARSGNGGLAGIAGLKLDLGSKTESLIVYRNYGIRFWSLFGNAFGEQSGPPQNEQGFYIGLKHTFTNRITGGTYFDQYHFPFARYRTNEASDGYDCLGYLDYQRNDHLVISLLGRYEQKQLNVKSQDALGRQIVNLGWHRHASLRIQVDYQSDREVRFRSRVEWVRTRISGGKPQFGLLLSQDIRWQINPKLRLQGRIMEFDTDSYDARIYEYENDMLYVMSTPSFSGKGERSYMVMKYSPTHFMNIYAKYDVTVFENKQVVGSGLDTINGNRRSHFGIEVRLRF